MKTQTNSKRLIRLFLFLILLSCSLPLQIGAQGLTSTSLSGFVLDDDGQALAGARIELQHVPSGAIYLATSLSNGRFFMPHLRIGGPYVALVSHLGFKQANVENLTLGLGQNNTLNFTLQTEALPLEEVPVVDTRIKNRAIGVETFINQQTLSYLPNIQRSILDFTRLNPQAGLAGFAGKGPRDNFISIDGSAFNNAYGVGGNSALLVGNVVGAQPLSLDAIEAIQIKLSPFEVRQGRFTGAGIHAVTKSGSNDFKGTVYSFFRNEKMLGQKIDQVDSPLSDFNQNLLGLSIGGPLVINKLFFFVNYERERRSDPATDFVANRPGLSANNVTRVLSSDLDALSSFLNTTYGYTTGAYENYPHETQNDKLLVKLDWNISLKHQFSLRYNQLSASQEFSPSNSGSFGAGSRVDNPFSMAFENTGGLRTVNTHSIVAEWNSFIGTKGANRLIAGYSFFPDSREIKGDLFPAVDILKDGRNYISFGSHLFASNNSIRQKTYHIQDDYSLYLGPHTFTLGLTWEYFQFDYHFTPAAAGSFVFNSLDDFYNSAPENTTTPIGPSTGMGPTATYARTYSALAANASTEVHPAFSQFGAYLQEEYQIKNLRIVAGLRVDLTSYPQTPMANPEIATLTFQDKDGNPETFTTDQLPKSSPQFSPRIGFNWTPSEVLPIQLRGGSGIFTGRSPFVRLGDQYANNGLLQGTITAKNNMASKYPFDPDPNAYIPLDEPAATYDLNVTSVNFKMPQLWKSALGIDYELPGNISTSLDFIYSNDLQRDIVRNANLDHTDKGNSVDGRFVFSNSRLNNPPILGAYVLDNTAEGEQFYATFQIKKKYTRNWLASLAYTYGYSKDINTFSASSSRTAYRSLPVLGNTNQAVLAFSDDHQQHRLVGAAAYSFRYKNFGSTTISLFLEGAQRGRFSYTYSGKGDVNKDGIPTNDLIFVPANAGEIALEEYNSNGQAITSAEQWLALDNFINRSEYLSQRRGQFAERNGSAFPAFFQTDLRLIQDIYFKISKKKNTVQITLDIINFTNLLNSQWGVQHIAANQQPIEATKNGKFRVNPSFLGEEFLVDTGLGSRWQMQVGLRYIFN